MRPVTGGVLEPLRVIYEDDHLIGINKRCGDLVEGDTSGDEPLVTAVERYLNDRTPPPPGGVFAGVIHRLDRPTSGCVVYAKTPAAQRQMNALFRPVATAAGRGVTKTYWAVVDNEPPREAGELEHFIYHDRELNKSYTFEEPREKAKRARLAYRLLGRSERYAFLEIDLITGRHHQIRAQLAAVGCHIKGDLKYGARRSNPEGGIHLHARAMSFLHPIRQHPVMMVAEPPDETLWNLVVEIAQERR
ncbi:MAG: RluA family pseudouridine synthase [Spirochaetota bacterium]